MSSLKRGALPRSSGVVVPRLSDHIDLDAVGAAAAQLPWAGDGAVDRQSKVSQWPMYLNDRLGDCTCAAMGHAIAQWTAYSGKVPGGAMFTDNAIQGLYTAVDGYNPVTGANDNGAELYQVCNQMMTGGLKDTAGNVHKLAGYCDVSDFATLARLKDILNAFGSVYLGMNVGSTEENDFGAGKPWTLPAAGTNVGPGGIDHCVVLSFSAINDAGVTDNETIITWGAEQKMNEAWAMTNIGEAVAIFTQDWLDAAGDSPIGQAAQAIVAELAALPRSSVNPSHLPPAATLKTPRCPFCGLAFGTCSHSQGVNPV
jgi:hypothetical protein